MIEIYHLQNMIIEIFKKLHPYDLTIKQLEKKMSNSKKILPKMWMNLKKIVAK
jgi:hypothetical protein